MPVRAVPPYGIPRSGMPYDSSCIPIKPVLGSGYACFRVCYGAYQALKWTVSRANMVLIAGRKNYLQT